METFLKFFKDETTQKLVWISFSAILPFHVCLHAYSRKSLTLAGCLAAYVMGFTTLALQPIVGGMILSFFFLGKLVTKIGKSTKVKIEEDFTETRNAWQVLANGGIPLFFTVIKSLSAENYTFEPFSCFISMCPDHRMHMTLVGSLAAIAASYSPGKVLRVRKRSQLIQKT